MPGTTPALAPGGARRARHPLHGIVATAVTILTVAGCHDPLANPGEAEAARTHLDAVLNQMELHSLRRRDIDWTQLRATVTAQASDPADLSDVFPAIETALAMLGDGRSSYVAPSEWGYPTFKAPSGCTGPQAQTLIAPPDIGYVRDSSFDDPAGLAAVWAGLIYIDLLRADSRDPAGWIVDLRGNASNTSMWPGVLGVGPLLGEGTVAWFVNADGGESRLELLSRNLVLDGQTVLTPITGAFPRAQRPPCRCPDRRSRLRVGRGHRRRIQGASQHPVLRHGDLRPRDSDTWPSASTVRC